MEKRSQQQPTDVKPDITFTGPFTAKKMIQIEGDFDYVKKKIEKKWNTGDLYPDFKILDLGNNMHNITDKKPDAEPQYVVAKKVNFRERKDN